jgi:KDO2-lipid IV(A) lauroyltransferase
MARKRRAPLRWACEYLLVWVTLKTLGSLPRAAAVGLATAVAKQGYTFMGARRAVGLSNVAGAMPDICADRRTAIVKGAFLTVGRAIGEFSQFRKLTADRLNDILVVDGLHHYADAVRRGQGVVLIAGHLGAWELAAFAWPGDRPINVLVRRFENPWVDRLITGYRECRGNRMIDKKRAVGAVRAALRRGETVGMLIDVNAKASDGVFVDFFGRPACTVHAPAAVALLTGATVLPVCLHWDDAIRKHRLGIGAEIPVIRTGGFREDVRVNTARFTHVLEDMIRQHPDQWVWIHQRWKTRPEDSRGVAVKRDPRPAQLRARMP